MISSLQKLVGIGSDIGKTSSSSVPFNSTLPISIAVLKKIDPMRYRLKVGRKELTTKSHKTLKEGQSYWGNFFEGKGGVLTLSHLYKQPTLFENAEAFLPIGLDKLFEEKTLSYTQFKTFLLEQLCDETLPKNLFQTYTYMLLALNKHVLHVPFLHEGKKILLQMHYENSVLHFYIAFEHLGPLQGRIETGKLFLFCLYETSFITLKKALHQANLSIELGLEQEIEPLFDSNDLVLDLKG
ncbi:hypothetical protein [Sulfurospirillum barnesii]|uniref:Uncharacterized protein n=1 Tax=Sulfurospirillum barnesii (strain ATCC 700032 / DSM 10660 / SES-3) TaxID=760154 RepID=I3XWV8_SULBS|nr:hypothetical protein [Sulfurospirillum barnesii]AFL68432.1 hypothetical protein Sulba_1136 [Sulfurospirillum barnesii SES-3]